MSRWCWLFVALLLTTPTTPHAEEARGSDGAAATESEARGADPNRASEAEESASTESTAPERAAPAGKPGGGGTASDATTAQSSGTSSTVTEGGASLGTGSAGPNPADVSAAGGLVQTYPIAAFPDRRGKVPSLALVYSSQSTTSGIVGVGWSLPWSTITRQGLRGEKPAGLYSSAQLAAEQYTLTLWGNAHELLLDDTEPGGKILRTRYASAMRVEAANSFDQWVLHPGNGDRYYFTTDIPGSPGPRDTMFIDRIISPDEQNNVFFNYRAGNAFKIDGIEYGHRIVLPESIVYACPERTSAHCYRIEFVYEPDPRPDPVIRVMGGELAALTERLWRIVVRAPTGAIAWQYLVTYQTDKFNGHSQIASIDLQNADGQGPAPATTFEYQAAQPPHEDWALTSTDLPALSYKMNTRVAPMNDAVKQMLDNAGGFISGPNLCSSEDICIWQSKGDFCAGEATCYSKDEFADLTSTTEYAFVTDPFGAGAFFTDLNFDGLPDVVRRFHGPSWMATTHGENCINQGDRSFNCTSVASNNDPHFWLSGLTDTVDAECTKKAANPAVCAGFHNEERHVAPADMNGDGAMDLVRKLANGTGPVVTDLHGAPLADVAAFPPAFADTAPNGPDKQHRFVDLNGDGYADLLLHATVWLYQSATKTYVENPLWKLPIDPVVNDIDLQAAFTDLNGDGLVDLYSMPDVRAVDVNGDSLADLLPKVSEAEVQAQRGIFLNTGAGWQNVAEHWKVDWNANPTGSKYALGSGATWDHYYPALHVEAHPDWRLLDINGDGLVDFVHLQFKNILLGQAGGGWKSLATTKFSTPHFLNDNEDTDKMISVYPTFKGAPVDDTNRRFASPRYHFVDLDGDRFLDVVSSHGNFFAATKTTEQGQADISLNPLKVPPNRLTATINPLGSKTSYKYTTYAKSGHASGFGPRLVVASIETPLANTKTEYTYHFPNFVYAGPSFCTLCAEYDPARGPEARGFGIVTEQVIGYDPGGALAPVQQVGMPLQYTQKSEAGRRMRRTFYKSGAAYDGQVQGEEVKISEDLGKSWIDISTTTNTFHEPGGAEPVSLVPPYRALRATETITMHEGGDAPITTSFSKYDALGHAGKIHSNGRDGYHDTKTIERTYTDRTDPWVRGLLASEAVTINGQTVTTAYTYDDFGRTTAKTVSGTYISIPIWENYTYDTVSNLKTVTKSGALASQGERLITYDYDKLMHQFVTSTTDPLGHVHRTTYYGAGATEPMASAASFGKVARAFGPALPGGKAARYTATTYDTFGRPVQSGQYQPTAKGDTTLLYQTWKYSVDAAAGTSSVEQQAFGEQGATVPTFGGGGGFQGLGQWGGGSITLPMPVGRWNIVTSDALGRVLQTKTKGTNDWRVVETAYGPFGLPAAVSRPSAYGSLAPVTTTTYDALGRTIIVQGPTHLESYTYNGFTTSKSNGIGYTVTLGRDALDRLVHYSDSAGATTQITYSMQPQGTFTITGPDGAATVVERNPFGQITKSVDPDRGTMTWKLDADGNSTTATDALGVTTTSTYDAIGRTLTIDTQSDGAIDVRYFYDGTTPTSSTPVAAQLGRTTAMQDSGGITQWQYTPLGQLASVTRPIDGTTHRVTMQYDGFGRLTEYTHLEPQQLWRATSLFKVQYRYTFDGLAAIRARVRNQPWQPIIADRQFNGAGLLQDVQYANGVQEHCVYSPSTQLLEHYTIADAAGTPLLDYGYSYAPDAAHYLTGITDGVNAKFSQSFAYETNGALKSAESDAYGTLAYQTNPAGNLLHNGPWILHYDDVAWPHVVTSAVHDTTGQQIANLHNAAGLITKSHDRIMTYDDAQQLIRLQTSRGVTEFEYDGAGQRIKTTTTLISGGKTGARAPARRLPEVLWAQRQSVGQRPLATDGTIQSRQSPIRSQPPADPAQLPSTPLAPTPKGVGTPPLTPAITPYSFSTKTTRYPTPNIELVTLDSGAAYTRYHITVDGKRVATVRVDPRSIVPPQVVYYHTDHIGSRALMTSTTGTAIGARQIFTPYGTPVGAVQTTPWYDDADPSMRYVGVQQPEIAELYLTGPRLYDPVQGRFLQPDPIVQPVTSGMARNAFAYAGNNPVMLNDPSGLAAPRAGEEIVSRAEIRQEFRELQRIRGLLFGNPRLEFVGKSVLGEHDGAFINSASTRLPHHLNPHGTIVIQTRTLNTFYHEYGHYLHIEFHRGSVGGRSLGSVLDTAGNFIHSAPRRELIADLYMWSKALEQGRAANTDQFYEQNRHVALDIVAACGGPENMSENCSTLTTILRAGETTFVKKSDANFEQGNAEFFENQWMKEKVGFDSTHDSTADRMQKSSKDNDKHFYGAEGTAGGGSSVHDEYEF